MRVRILGGGWYGCHIALELLQEGHEVQLWESAPRLFSGASGGNPARLHLGYHYPRSHTTRAACQAHVFHFMERYGFLTRAVPVNIYAVAKDDSWVDFGTYHQVMRAELPCIPIAKPEEFGLQNVEGALLTGERHILIDRAREWFADKLADVACYNAPRGHAGEEPRGVDLTVDCTFCSYDAQGIDRYEPCITVLMRGPTDRAVTIMDGPFPSLYPWDEAQGLNSLTSASLTPLATCATHEEATKVLDTYRASDTMCAARAERMVAQLEHYWPQVRQQYEPQDFRLTIRAQPRSGSAARLVDVVRVGEKRLRIRAGKIDAIQYAADLVKGVVCSM